LTTVPSDPVSLSTVSQQPSETKRVDLDQSMPHATRRQP
jgi:hypothetical protein